MANDDENANLPSALVEFVEYVHGRLKTLGAKSVGDLPVQEQELIAQKLYALGPDYECRIAPGVLKLH
ncbi:MAG TPA: hypothetical protein VNZ56_15775 [Verrucomicrobiae bacterium]|jgi:hypothetical protein|nr:hypothetical protein [Verrucomicrobiae bacterium]